MTNITAPHFTDENAAREHLEALRWPEGPVCPHCGSVDVKRLPAQRGRPSKAHPEGKLRAGVIQCNGCREQFSVTIGTVFERSKVPLNKWLLATHLMVSSKKGMSAHQLHRMLGVTYKTAWFMAHRIRDAMVSDDNSPMGGGGRDVEVDETYIGRVPGTSRTPIHNMNKVIALVDRTTGRSTSIVFTGNFTAESVGAILSERVAPDSRLITDEARFYKIPGKTFTGGHQSVSHARGEYVRKADRTVHTNTIEGFFGIFKRGMRGVYQHCGSQHLQRYLAEFDFRYTNRSGVGVNDDQRRDIALRGIAGKRLTYRRIGPVAA
ncbi:IS1595 family transposase [Stakelama tenebrarum]|uniref:IS1595 family transposase n=1 Tax=Stakelama tenebrarum TaxID=2711215 RepID=A0A6G6Y0D9_9SPHN|nr:IS1595 family transposase [Sphingosinithalassobacter tenebrarum]QIG78385.1 IS1595 family transposase [Sphingosinithalassobacter tenebrarum]